MMKTRDKKRDDAVRDAVWALSDLNTFAICVTILEGGHLHGTSDAVAERIIKICKSEQQKLFRKYDRAVKKATTL